MHKILACLLCCFLSLVSQGQERFIMTDHSKLGAVVKGFSGYQDSPTGKFIYAQIEKANYANGVYRNVIRLWYGEGNNDYINLLYSTYPTEQQALSALHNDNRNGEKHVIVDWDAVSTSSQTISLTGASFYSETFSLQSRKSTRVSKVTSVNRNTTTLETDLNLSFEGLTLTENGFLEGVDAETGLNTSYYSRDSRIISLQGTEGKAWVELCDSPRREGKSVHFKAVTPNDRDIYGEKIRITGSISQLKAVEVVNSVDIYIPCSWKALINSDKAINWLTVQEYWCATAGVPIDGEPQFRMTLGILKKEGKRNKLYFNLKVQDLETTKQADGSWKEKYTDLYEFDDRKSMRFAIPFGQWFNLRTEIVAGDKQNGHFRLVATNKKGQEIIIFDDVCQTVATGYSKPGAKRPYYKNVSPLKLYTSVNTLLMMKGKPLDIYYDNWYYKAQCVDSE